MCFSIEDLYLLLLVVWVHYQLGTFRPFGVSQATKFSWILNTKPYDAWILVINFQSTLFFSLQQWTLFWYSLLNGGFISHLFRKHFLLCFQLYKVISCKTSQLQYHLCFRLSFLSQRPQSYQSELKLSSLIWNPQLPCFHIISGFFLCILVFHAPLILHQESHLW